MDILTLKVSETFYDTLLPMIIVIVLLGISSWKLKTTTFKFSRLIDFFKFIFYGFIVFLTLYLDVDNSLKVTYGLKNTLNVGEYLLVIVSSLEVVSNLFSFFDTTEFKNKLEVKTEIELLKMQIEDLKKSK